MFLDGSRSCDMAFDFRAIRYGNNRIRKVDSGTGIIFAVAGNGTSTFREKTAQPPQSASVTPSWVTFDMGDICRIIELNEVR